MAGNRTNRMSDYYKRLSGQMPPGDMLNGAMLAAETKAQNAGQKFSEIEAFEAMLRVAADTQIPNPYKDISAFFFAYMAMESEPDWEDLLYEGLKYMNAGRMLVPEVLSSLMAEHIWEGASSILIAEAEKFVPNLKSIVDRYAGRKFTFTAANEINARALERVFSGYENVRIFAKSIYEYGALNEKFDFIISAPTFGGRDLVRDSNFICREFEMIALENLLLHIAPSGRLAIIMPARITFAGGRVKELRDFIMQMYKLEEIAELPYGIFSYTGIKTFLLVIGEGRTEDVIVRKYEAPGRKTKGGLVESIELAEDTFVMSDELEEIGDWSIDKLLVQQDEEFLRYQSSAVRKIQLGEAAEIFRGKAVNKKDMNGTIGVMNISNIGQYEISYDSLDKINAEERRVQSYILHEGDVLLPARGTAIRTAVFHEQSYPCIASANVIVIRPNPKMLNSTFLKIFIDSPIGNGMISSLQQGATVMNISYKDLKLLEVPFPSLEEQEKAAKEYDESYQVYKQAISKAEEKWNTTLSKLQNF